MEPTDRIAIVDGVKCRFWEGVTESGTRCVVFVHRIAVHCDDDLSEFDRELVEGPAPDKVIVGDMRQDWG
jgi:hypothetical protein